MQSLVTEPSISELKNSAVPEDAEALVDEVHTDIAKSVETMTPCAAHSLSYPTTHRTYLTSTQPAVVMHAGGINFEID